MSIHNKIFSLNFCICYSLNTHTSTSEHVPVQVPIFIAFERDNFTSESSEEQPKLNKFSKIPGTTVTSKINSQQSFPDEWL